LEPSDFDPIVVADAIVKVVDAPFGKWPLRVELMLRRMAGRFVNGVADRVSTEMFRRVCLKDLLEPRLLSDSRQQQPLDTRSPSGRINNSRITRKKLRTRFIRSAYATRDRAYF